MSSQYSEGCEAHDKMVDFRTKKKKEKKRKNLAVQVQGFPHETKIYRYTTIIYYGLIPFL